MQRLEMCVDRRVGLLLVGGIYQKVDAGSARRDAELGRSTEGPAGCHDRGDCSGISTRLAYVPALLSDEGRCCCCYQKVDAGRLEETQNSVDQLRAQLAAMTASTASLVDNTHQQSQVIQVDS